MSYNTKSNAIGIKRFHLNQLLKYVVLIIITMIVIVPLMIIVLSAFKTLPEISQMKPLSLPKKLYLGNFIETFKKAKIILALTNTFIIAGISVVINVFLGAMTSYIISRFDFKGKKIVMALFLVAMIIPFYTIEVARFGLIRDIHLYNTLFAPILIYIGADMMQIFVYKQYIDKVSVSLDESAMIEGASYITIFFKVIFPLVIPAAATLAIIKFVDITNDMYIPYLYIPSDKFRTLSTALMLFAGDRSIDWGSISACIIWVMIPTLTVYLFFQKYILAGITAGAVKE
jgi:multiple sugar transport system permease protein